MFDQVCSVTNRQPAVQRNSRAHELKQLTGLQLRDIANKSMDDFSEVKLIKTYISQSFTGANDSRLILNHALLDRACKASRFREKNIHACLVMKGDGDAEEVMLRLFSVV